MAAPAPVSAPVVRGPEELVFLSHPDIVGLGITPADVIRAVEQGLLKKHSVILPPKIHINLPGNIFWNTMPCVFEDFYSCKMVNRYPGHEPAILATMVMGDMHTGQFVAHLDATWITAMRTGAVAALTVKYVAKKSFSTIGMLGLGATGTATLHCLAALFPDRPMTIKLLRYKDHAEVLRSKFEHHANLHILIVDTMEALCRGSDVVISAVTAADRDLAQPEWFESGVTIIPIHTRGFMNMDLVVDQVVGDDTGHVCDFRNFKNFRKFTELCDVMLNPTTLGRRNDTEKILCYNIGLAVHDLFVGRLVLERARAHGVGIRVPAPLPGKAFL
ncbi:putative ornithine cyclodeaminase [Paratrimastix pyriformis]|uniref:Ornithine cyclodeaminase n=1 Tax=Paratrimastix pyriformis TaxID=342808 RepID=A0ABQ8UAD1_9EUKA|nr:putative ornithine cyclodeaminase [Paratrimastix pyriformis]